VNEDKLYQECIDLKIKLNIISKNTVSNEDNIKQLFAELNGKVNTHKYNTYIKYDGYIENYSISGSLYYDDLSIGYIRLIEDLVMAYYRNNGGTNLNTYELMNKLKSI